MTGIRVINVDTYPDTAALVTVCPKCGDLNSAYVDYEEPPGWQWASCGCELMGGYPVYWSRDRRRQARRNCPSHVLMSRVTVQRRIGGTQ